MKRIQRKRTKGWRMPNNTVYVGRGSRWGNPFNKTQIAVCFDHHGFPMPLMPLRAEPSLDRCLDLYTAWLAGELTHNPDLLEPLAGKDMACWCPLDKPCHADVLLDLVSRWYA